MITIEGIEDTKQVGYLGNQLFMVATALGLKAHSGDEVVLPPFDLQNLFEITPFTIRPKCEISTSSRFTEPGFGFKDIHPKKDVTLQGYFQSWKYFENLDIAKIFSFTEEIRNSASKHLDSMDLAGKNICSVHLRRGDYLNLSYFHTNLPASYYNEAIALMREQTNVDGFLFFSDDIQWVKQNFHGDDFFFSETPKEKTQGNSSAVLDLVTMTRCSNHIIANSTFSWWGAFLGINPNKTVISPNGDKYKWFGVNLRHLDTKDLIPPGWMTL